MARGDEDFDGGDRDGVLRAPVRLRLEHLSITLSVRNCGAARVNDGSSSPGCGSWQGGEMAICKVCNDPDGDERMLLCDVCDSG